MVRWPLSSAQVEGIIQTIGFTYNGNSPDKLSKILFVIHTFNSLLIKLLAAEIVSQIPQLTSYSDFAQNTLVSLSTHLTVILNIHNFMRE